MSISAESMLKWCQTVLNVDGRRPVRSLSEYLSSIPRLASLSDVKSGTPVLIRGDVDAKPGAQDRRGGHPFAVDGRNARVRSQARLEANHLRSQGAKARGDAGQSGRADRRTTQVRRAALGQLARRIYVHHQRCGGGANPLGPPGQRPGAREHSPLRHRACRFGRPPQTTCRSFPSRWHNLLTKSPRRSPRSTLTKPFRRAAWTRRRRRSGRDAAGGAGCLRRQGIRWPDAALSRNRARGLQRTQDRQARRSRSHDRPRQGQMVFTAGSLAMALKKAAAELDGKHVFARPGRRPRAC